MALLLAAIFAGSCNAASLKAEVVEIKGTNHAIISKGAADGVQAGMTFYILNDNFQQVGTFTALEVEEAKATGIFNMYESGAIGPQPGTLIVYGADAAAAGPKASEIEIVVPANTVVEMELQEDISSQKNRTGDIVPFFVKYPVSVGGFEVVSAGAKAYGEITDASPAKGYGKSGKLEFTIKFVEASDGTKIPLSFELEKKQGNQYAKAAVGTYMTAGLGGGAMKGKKINIAKGTMIKVFVPQDTKLRGAGVTMVSAPDGSGRQQSVTLKRRETRNPSEIKLAFLGLNDTFNEDNSDEQRYLASKVATFIAYNLQWETPFQFVNQNEVIAKSSSNFSKYFLKKGLNVPPEKKYDIEKIVELGNDMGADYVIAGDMIDYVVTETKKRDKARALLNVFVTPGDELKDWKKTFEFKSTIDIAIIDVKRGEVAWTQVCEGEHKVTKWLDTVDSHTFAKSGRVSFRLHLPIDKELARVDDPIAFAGTEEGVAIMKIVDPFMTELPNLF